jgi:hypothetical protein
MRIAEFSETEVRTGKCGLRNADCGIFGNGIEEGEMRIAECGLRNFSEGGFRDFTLLGLTFMPSFLVFLRIS